MKNIFKGLLPKREPEKIGSIEEIDPVLLRSAGMFLHASHRRILRGQGIHGSEMVTEESMNTDLQEELMAFLERRGASQPQVDWFSAQLGRVNSVQGFADYLQSTGEQMLLERSPIGRMKEAVVSLGSTLHDRCMTALESHADDCLDFCEAAYRMEGMKAVTFPDEEPDGIRLPPVPDLELLRQEIIFWLRSLADEWEERETLGELRKEPVSRMRGSLSMEMEHILRKHEENIERSGASTEYPSDNIPKVLRLAKFVTLLNAESISERVRGFFWFLLRFVPDIDISLQSGDPVLILRRGDNSSTCVKITDTGPVILDVTAGKEQDFGAIVHDDMDFVEQYWYRFIHSSLDRGSGVLTRMMRRGAEAGSGIGFVRNGARAFLKDLSLSEMPEKQ